MKKQHLIFNLISAIFFAIVFFKNYLGLNVLLFTLMAVAIMIYLNRPLRRTLLTNFLLLATIISSIMFVIHNSSWNLFLNILFLISLSTELFYGGFKSYAHNFAESFFRIFSSQISIFLPWFPQYEMQLNQKISNTETKSHYHFDIRKMFFVIFIPAVIFILFFIIYAKASSIFYNKLQGIINFVVDFISSINIVFVLLIFLGLIVGNVLYMKTVPVGIKKRDSLSGDFLTRVRKRHYQRFRNTVLKTFYQTGVVLMILLNILIFYFNILDVVYLWFGFKWDGSFLKEFVHEGTWLLVFSVILSAAIALNLFKDNINFYSKNKLLKILTLIWIIQNMVMVISVFIRNYWYIHYFNLAYKRIAVIFFLVLVFFGLITVIIKILKLKSSYFLWRMNSLALIIVLFISGLFNWDIIIAKYNFNHADRAFLDLKFYTKMGYSALPYTYKSSDELEKIIKIQETVMPFDIHQDYFYDVYTYESILSHRLKDFEKKINRNKFLEWNYADYRTKRLLKDRGIIK
ncbi:MAG: DUF4173 domain-containing protein [Bacteroidales bacterium]